MLIRTGLLRRELHPFITVGEIREGSFVKLTDYELAWGNGVGNRKIAYLRILDLYEYAKDGRQQTDAYVYEVAPVLASPRPKSRREGYEEEDSAHTEDILADTSKPVDTNLPNIETEEEEEVSLIKHSDEILQGGRNPAEEVFEMTSIKRKREESASPLKESDPNISSSPRKAPRLGTIYSQEASSKAPTKPSNPFPPKLAAQTSTKPLNPSPARISGHSLSNPFPQTPTKRQAQPPNPPPPKTASRSSNLPPIPKAPLPSKLIPIPRPLILSPLSSLVGRNSSRNKPVDVLALVTYVSPETFQRTGAPLGRNIRIMDTSTPKRVLLSVFTSPEQFLPQEGDVALFRNVTTHEWDGGSLKAWESWCEGREWYVREEGLGKVRGIEGWEERVKGLKGLWEVVREEQL